MNAVSMRLPDQILSLLGCSAVMLAGLGMPMSALAADPAAAAPSSNVTLSAGQVDVQAGKSTTLQMYLPNSGALAGGKSNRVLGASFSTKKAGTVLTLSSGYHARNNRAIRGYMEDHALHAPGARGSLSAHWANETELYGDIRFNAQDVLPSIELESLHELGLTKTLSNGFTMGINAKSKNDRQSITTQLGYARGHFKYSGVLTQNMLGGQGLSGKQHLQMNLGKGKRKVSLNGGVQMRTMANGAFETFPYAAAQMTVKGIKVAASYKRDPRLRIAGQFVETTQLKAVKSFLKGRLTVSTDTALRNAATTDGLVSMTLGLTYTSPTENEAVHWSVNAAGTVLDGAGAGGVLGLSVLDTQDTMRSAIAALGADLTFQLSRKTQLGFKGAAKHLFSTLGTYSRATLSTSVKHGLWNVEAMAGLNSARENTDAMTAARGGLHHRFAQKAFGQFTQQRAIFSFKVKYSY